LYIIQRQNFDAHIFTLCFIVSFLLLYDIIKYFLYIFFYSFHPLCFIGFHFIVSIFFSFYYFLITQLIEIMPNQLWGSFFYQNSVYIIYNLFSFYSFFSFKGFQYQFSVIYRVYLPILISNHIPISVFISYQFQHSHKICFQCYLIIIIVVFKHFFILSCLIYIEMFSTMNVVFYVKRNIQLFSYHQ